MRPPLPMRERVRRVVRRQNPRYPEAGEISMPKILLVEDNEMNRDMLSRRLQRKGYTVVTAEDGEKGLSLARSEAPDLILMDISLPVMGGWEVRSEEHTSELQSLTNL